jgi:molecular chaperone GrpE
MMNEERSFAETVGETPVDNASNPESTPSESVIDIGQGEPIAIETPVTENSVSEGEESGETLPPEVAIAALQREIETLKQQLEERDTQVDAYKKRYIGLAAEFDNFRKRTSKEKDELEMTIKGKTLTELLSVVDNFERARTQIKPANDGEMNIHKSYQGVYKTFVDSLKKLGVSPMRPEGQPFDPTYHEAMMREYTDEYPEGTVIEQLVRGYVLGDRVLRHALVKVAAPTDGDPDAGSRSVSESPEIES